MQIKNRQQLLAIVAGAAIGLFAADKLLLTPLTRLWGRRADQVAKLRKDVDDGKRLVAREQSLPSACPSCRRRTLKQ